MKKETAKSWCLEATRLIKFPPDREAVQEELEQHLIDKQEDLRQQGVPKEQIEALAIAAMGSAEEIAPQLAAIHRPFWGYAYRVCCAILALCMLISVPLLSKSIVTNMKKKPWKKPSFVSLHAEKGDKLLLYTQPNTTSNVADYSITVTQVALYQANLFETNQQTDLHTDFAIQIKVQHPCMYSGATIIENMWAEDSFGNVYASSSSRCGGTLCKEKHLAYTHERRYGFAHYYTLVFEDQLFGDFLSKDAQWIDLHYDRDGAKFTIRIDLLGGDQE